MANTMPPLAEPSSLVSTTPVTCEASPNSRAWARPFWPVVASITRSTSVTRPAPFSATRRTLRSSSIRFVLVCRRPAVSASTRSMPRDVARSTASKTTALGSPPSLPRTSSASARSAHVASCSAAAARNVSPAASSTRRPSPRCWLATLPIVVVLPTPLTPTNSHTLGLSSSDGSKCSSRSAPARRSCISACRASSSSSGSVISLALTRLAQLVEQLRRDADADVGPQQRLLEVLPRLLGDPAPAADAGEGAGQGRCGPAPCARAAWPAGRRPRARRSAEPRLDDLRLEHGASAPRWGLGRRGDRRRRRGVDRALAPAAG